MQINEFKLIVSAFADPGTEILFEKSRVVISVNGDLLDPLISTNGGDVFVDDGGGPIAASQWVLTRLAKLPLLANRLKEGVGDTSMFVSPAAELLPSLESKPDEKAISTDDALGTTLAALGDESPLETTILYITSDAGEGKTFLINQMAKEQAKLYSEGKSSWLLVPIPLGGKHFLRFDDITVGVLQNRYRFPFLYYDSFLALVRMGVIVPAFDGFEEMLVESSSGEALSAMGILVGALDSRGSMVIAARKAYFEFENLKSQEKLFDTIRSHSVGFAKLELARWGEPQFLTYCSNRKIPNAKEIYDSVSERLGVNHSLLTRPVLVRRLVDIAVRSQTLDAFIEQIQVSGQDFFAVFVRGIIEREANEKWIDRSGEKELGTPLLSVDEHCELLSSIALATWEARVDFLKRDHLEFVTDYFSELKRKSAFEAQQIRERIRGHALLIASPNAPQAIEFDHEEFRQFFIGEGIASLISPFNEKAKGEVLAVFRRAVLPNHAKNAFLRAIDRTHKSDHLKVLTFLLELVKLDGQASYTHENCSSLIICLLGHFDAQGLLVSDLAFEPDALRDAKIKNVKFSRCFFSPTSMEHSSFEGCEFTNCNFGQLRIYRSTVLENVVFDACGVEALRLMDRDVEVWEPGQVRGRLRDLGVKFVEVDEDIPPVDEEAGKIDLEIQDLEKLIRYFMRSTHISESIILMKLGNRARQFLDDTLPQLLEAGVMAEIENRGGSTQRRFRFEIGLEDINDAISQAQGSYAEFIDLCKEFER